MVIDFRDVPADTRELLLAALSASRETLHDLLVALKAGRLGEAVEAPMERLDVVEAASALIRQVAARTDAAGRASLRPILARLANERDDLATIGRHRAPARAEEADEELEAAGDDAWTPDLP